MNCIFCRIAAGEVPATMVGRSEHALAFRDLNPQAPTHVLVIPMRHFDSAANVPDTERAAVFGEVIGLAVTVAAEQGLTDRGYRMVINSGKQGGQSVDHVHVHLLGGRQMHWPPG